MISSNGINNLPEVVLRLSRSIRHCAVIDRYGNVVASMTRKDLQHLTDRNSQRQALQAAMRHFTTPSWARDFGRMHYNVSRYEKVIGAVVTLTSNYLMLVAFDHDTNEFDRIIMKRILPIVKDVFKAEYSNHP